ncbi:MAG TPA: hypothetical protein VH352_26300 [Pseudonocardiaceae bacterium]|nr:hypothetical protein [Pseudonocardiaceae bacterium]
MRRGGFPSHATARRARDALLAATTVQRTARVDCHALAAALAATAHHEPADHTAALHLRCRTDAHPRLGCYRLADLGGRLLRTVFDQIAATTNTKGRPQSASALQPLRTTLRAALNLAVK